jgi:hypothetical protein
MGQYVFLAASFSGNMPDRLDRLPLRDRGVNIDVFRAKKLSIGRNSTRDGGGRGDVDLFEV